MKNQIMYKILEVFNVFALVLFLGVMLLQIYILFYYLFLETDNQKKIESLIGISLFAIQSFFFLGIPSIFSGYITREITPHTSKILIFFVLIQAAISLWSFFYTKK